MFATVVASHLPPRAVAIPCAFKAAAIWRRDFAAGGLGLTDSWRNDGAVRVRLGLMGRVGDGAGLG